MKVQLSHAQRRLLANLEHGDLVLHPTDNGRFAGAVIVERESNGSLVLVTRDGVPQHIDKIAEPDELEVGPLFMSRKLMRAEAHNHELALSRMEWALLWTLASDPQRVFDKRDLLRDVWGYESAAATRTVDAHACRLRKKLADAGIPDWVVSTRAIGYRLQP